MKHPTQEQWMDFLYGEISRPEKKEIESHLKICPPCQQQRVEYEDTLGSMNAWRVSPAASTQPAFVVPRLVRWAAAAALLVTTGFATARYAAPPLKAEAIQAQIAEPLRERLTQEFEARLEEQNRLLADRLHAVAERAADAAMAQQQLAAVFAALKDQDAALYAAMRQMDVKMQSVREDLEKVALYTDRNVRSTERQLVQLASMNQKVIE